MVSIAPDGTLDPAAGARRAFHRPHSGFPVWTASEDPAEVRDEAGARYLELQEKATAALTG